ncbi:transposase [Methylocystis iwaonis]|uniref:Transposase n=1 Tax=Methylocystis iwaonis TaxID=2885079 RepID=A0ABN6VL55_9HYPH|nr:transposase [Methylocystis iwaonis]
MSKKTLLLDLRERVVAAVSSGMSRRQAAERFGDSAASAIRWCQRQKEIGSPASYKPGGDRWSARIDAHKSLILSLVEETCDIALSIGALWRFFDRHDITWKKRPLTRASRTGRTS